MIDYSHSYKQLRSIGPKVGKSFFLSLSLLLSPPFLILWLPYYPVIIQLLMSGLPFHNPCMPNLTGANCPFTLRMSTTVKQQLIFFTFQNAFKTIDKYNPIVQSLSVEFQTFYFVSPILWDPEIFTVSTHSSHLVTALPVMRCRSILAYSLLGMR